MRQTTYFIYIIALFLSLTACNEKKPVKNNNTLLLIPSETAYTFKINNKKALQNHGIVILNQFLNNTEQQYLAKLPFESTFIINILENNSKIKGFVAVGKTTDIDSVFQEKKYSYEQYQIIEDESEKTTFYASVINGQTLVSNQKLFIENCIRQASSLVDISQSEIFMKGMNTLDQNADVNLMVQVKNLQNDPIYQSKLQVPVTQWADWEFYDLIDENQQVYSGMSLTKDSTQTFIKMLSQIKTSENINIQLVPYTASEIINISFEDYPDFYQKYRSFFNIAKPINNKLLSLSAITFFIENNNKAVILALDNPNDFLGENPAKIMSIAEINIYKNSDNTIINTYFSKIFPSINASFAGVFENHIILTDNKIYLQKIINDYQNNSSLVNETSYKKLAGELPENCNLEIIKVRQKIGAQKYITARTYNGSNSNTFVNYVVKKITQETQNNLVQQIISYEPKDQINNKPQLVFNHQSKQYNIIYQNNDNEVVLVSLKGKILWKTKVKGEIIGKIHQIDLLRNHKLQYTFVTPHHWYVIDRLGRIVENFPEHFIQKITKGVSVFDYENNRKYRFGISQGRKFRLYDNTAKKVNGFKVKTHSDIIFSPQHFRIKNKDFIVIQDDQGKVYLLNRRGETRIKVNKKFNISRNNWGVYHQKFVNIDDDNNIVSIDLQGKIKSAKVALDAAIQSRIKHNCLAAISDNKLLINEKINTLDLGNYERPIISRQKDKIYIMLSNTDTHKIYGFDNKAQTLNKFPVIGDKIIDVQSNQTGKYILAYDQQNNLIVYKF